MFVLFAGCAPAPTVAPPRVLSPEEKLGVEFARLKNAGDPKAAAMLEPLPAVPVEPVSPDEAQRWQTDFFLHGDYKVIDVRPADGQRIVLATEGALSSDVISVRTPEGVDRVGRAVANPDLLVEVRDGKLYGVRADLHSDPNARPLTPAEQERIRKMLGVPPQR